MPTLDQALSCMRICQSLSNGYQSIHLFRYDEEENVVFILAGETGSLEITIFPDGHSESA
ncbi:MAG: hypothetical protein AAF810_11665 [Cyanobacteria bacterium P01_D01_bin.36]